MPSSPNTPLVLQTIQTMVQALQVTGASTPFFLPTSVIIGKSKDPTDLVPLFEITLSKDMTKRYTVAGAPVQGGQIDDSQEYLCEIVLDNSDPETTEFVTLPSIRDAFTEAIHSSAQLGLPGLVDDSRFVGDGEYGYTNRSDTWYRAYRQILKVRYAYYVTMVP